jgi:hypothetical protein
MTRGNLVLGVLILCLAVATAAQAIVPTQTHEGEISAPAGVVTPAYRQLNAQESSRVLPGWDAFKASGGNGWMVIQYRDDLQTPATMIGPGIPVTTIGASKADIGQAVSEFVAARAGIFKADPSGFGPSEVTPLNDTKSQVILPQVYRGLEVVGGRVEVYLDGGKVVMMGSHYFPGITIGVDPMISASRAQVAAIAGVKFSPVTDSFEGEPRLVVYPMVLDGAPSYFLAWEMKFKTASPVGYWWTYVDATDGEVLVRTNEVDTFDIPTTVHSDVNLNWSTDPLTEIPSRDHAVRVNGADSYTDTTGFVNLTVPTADPYNVSAWIRGRYCNVQRYAGEGANASFTGPGTPGTPLAIKWDDTNSLASERDAFYSTNRVHKWLKEHDPTFTSMDFPMYAFVNRTDGTCNAFWDGANINFYKEGGGCVNAATISDVVMHEYGHGISQYTYAPQQPPNSSGMGEALGDIVAQAITGDRYMGHGFYGGSSFIRDGMNTRQYPGASCAGEVHCLGEILMGAMWKTRTNMIAAMGDGPGAAHYDDVVRFAWKTKQNTMPDYLTKVLLGDDNNANIADGTPNWDGICAAFAAHNLPCPEITQFISFTHTPLADQVNTVDPIAIAATVVPLGCGDLVADSLRLHYSTDGLAWTSLLMVDSGVPGEFYAEVPAQECGTIVNYYLTALTTTGVTGQLPDNAPGAGVYRFMVGARTTVLSNTFETDQGWTVGAPGDAAVQGIWERVDPVGKANGTVIYQPEDDHTPDPGVLCYVTDGRGGSNYLQYDVDGGATSVLSPVYDFSTGSGVCKLDFWAFLMTIGPADDTLRVSVTNDNGNTWLDIWKIYGAGYNAWNNYKVYFTSAQVPFTSQMQFRFRVADFNTSTTEAAFDDVIVRRTTCAPTANGACCTPGGTCRVTTPETCATPDTWQGPGTICSPNPCALPTGACCAADGTCTVTTAGACATPSTFLGLGTNCSPNVCPASAVSETLIPARFAVEPARPNPMNAGSSFRFALPAASTVGVELFDAGGRLVRTLVQGSMMAGYHDVRWDGNDAAGRAVVSGVYYYRVRANDQEQTRKILVVR